MGKEYSAARIASGVVAAFAMAVIQPAVIQGQSVRSVSMQELSSTEILARTVEAHGGQAAFDALPGLSYWFFTRNTGAPDPWLSVEAIDHATGRSVIEWPVFGAKIWADGESAWSQGWPMGFSPGFFPYLTASFVTLPFLLDGPGVYLDDAEHGTLPGDETNYLTIRITFDDPGGRAPGTFYRMYIDPTTFEYKAIEFDISHPGLVANPNQPLGPNIHVFQEYKAIGGVTLPSYYTTFGQNRRTGSRSTADHWLFAVSADRPFEEVWGDGPEGELDSTTVEFWTRTQRQ